MWGFFRKDLRVRTSSSAIIASSCSASAFPRAALGILTVGEAKCVEARRVTRCVCTVRSRGERAIHTPKMLFFFVSKSDSLAVRKNKKGEDDVKSTMQSVTCVGTSTSFMTKNPKTNLPTTRQSRHPRRCRWSPQGRYILCRFVRWRRRRRSHPPSPHPPLLRNP